MRPSLLITLLLLSTLISEVQGIRFKKELKPQVIGTSDAGVGDDAIHCKDAHCPSNVIMKSRISRMTKEFHHRLPKIHEDYCGPRSHKPRHH